MMVFTSTSAPVDDQGVKMLVYSPAGFGKTVLGATMPGETVIISAESGLLSLQPANQMRLFGAIRDIPVIKITSGFEFRQAYEFILTNPHAQRFVNVVVDSISEIAEVTLANELKAQKDPRKAYGITNDLLTTYIRLFRDLPNRNVLMTAKQDREKDGEGLLMFGPSMPGKTLNQNIAHFFDEVFALVMLARDAQGVSRRALRCLPDAQYIAKDRSGALLELEHPNLSVIIQKIKNQKVA